MLGPEKPKKKDGYRMEEMDGELLLFNPENATILYCNQTSVLIWHLCDGTRTVDEMIALLAESYPESAEDIDRDVRECVETLHGLHAVEYV